MNFNFIIITALPSPSFTFPMAIRNFPHPALTYIYITLIFPQTEQNSLISPTPDLPKIFQAPSRSAIIHAIAHYIFHNRRHLSTAHRNFVYTNHITLHLYTRARTRITLAGARMSHKLRIRFYYTHTDAIVPLPPDEYISRHEREIRRSGIYAPFGIK